MNSCIGFAAYRLPGQEEPQLIIQEHGECVMSKDGLSALEDGFVMLPFCEGADKPSLCIHEDRRLHGIDDVCDYLKNSDYDIKGINHCTRTDYHNAFNKFINALNANEYEKLVLSSTRLFLTSYAPWEIFRTACSIYPQLMVYMCYTQAFGLWIGCTPEIILDGCGNKFHTIALAGTQTILPGGIIRKWNDKNVREQELVKTYISETITPFSSVLDISSPYSFRAGGLAHIRTDFFFELKDGVKVTTVLQAIHPTPAVCGLPQKEAYRFICENEEHDRRYYAGIVGPVRNKEIHLYVNLRCAELFKHAARVYVGGGLLRESEEASEYDELKAKMKTIKSLL